MRRSRFLVSLLASIFAGYFSNLAKGAPGGFDPTFDYNGILKTDFGSYFTHQKFFHSWEFATALALQADGRIVAGGFRETSLTVITSNEPQFVNSGRDFALARYLPDGRLDPSFGDGGRVVTDMGTVEDELFHVFALPDGKILAVGHGESRIAIARYLADGSLDASFGEHGKVLLPQLGWYRVTVQPDGKLLVLAPRGVARIAANGDLDKTFGNNGIALVSGDNTSSGFDWPLRAMALLPNGNIAVFGENNYRPVLYRLLPDGTKDSSFGVSGMLELPDGTRASSLMAQKDGTLLMLAAVNKNYGGPTDISLIRVNQDGSPDVGFGGSGKVVTDFDGRDENPQAMTLTPEGKIVVVGGSNFYGQSGTTGIVCYNSDGSLNSAFGDGGKKLLRFTPPDGGMTNSEVSAAQLQSDGRLLLGGYMSTGGGYDFFLARLVMDGSSVSASYRPEVDVDVADGSTDEALPQNRQAMRRKPAKPHRRTVTIDITVRNLGTTYDSYVLKGTRERKSIRVQYFSGNGDVTRDVTRGTFRTAVLSPEDVVSLTARVTLKGAASAKQRHRALRLNFALVARSSTNSTSANVAFAKVDLRKRF